MITICKNCKKPKTPSRAYHCDECKAASAERAKQAYNDPITKQKRKEYFAKYIAEPTHHAKHIIVMRQHHKKKQAEKKLAKLAAETHPYITVHTSNPENDNEKLMRFTIAVKFIEGIPTATITTIPLAN
jgi:predicted amidophosphoribosyltransferase